MEKVIKYLWESTSKEKRELSPKNHFKKIGFDGEKPRLGWVRPPSWRLIEKSLKDCLKIIKDKKEFIFVGMGGSINGIKTVVSLKKKSFIFTLDSLDPQALRDILSKLQYLKNTLVIAISKSATTKETQLITHSLKIIFKEKAKEHFLWLVDKDSYRKLDSLGWKNFFRLPIQVDSRQDCGGRFSCPHTLIFFLPLFLILNKNLRKLKKLYNRYRLLGNKILGKAYYDAFRYRDTRRAYFSIRVRKDLLEDFKTWITQLFQESLGSKKQDFPVKTIVRKRNGIGPLFNSLSLNMKIASPVVEIMSTMYYLENFVAFYAFFKQINFVNQPYVEVYKQRMKKLSYKNIRSANSGDYKRLIYEIKENLKPHHKFIEIIFYFHPSKNIYEKIRRNFIKNFSKTKVLIFIGSDWNHHSYQAAFLDRYTLYVFLAKDSYQAKVPFIYPQSLKENIRTLKLISYATYLTLKDKSIFFTLR